MSLRQVLAANGGWLHRADLLDDGWSSRRILDARRAEGIPLLRRRWLLLPDTPAPIREAALVGGTVTCASAIPHHGLWLPPEMKENRVPHVAVKNHASDAPPDGICHRARPVAPRHPRSLIDPVENVLAYIATCLPQVQAFAVWESAEHAKLVAVEHLHEISWPSVRARELAAGMTGKSDSGVESMFVWQCRRAGIDLRQQVWIAGRPVDALIGQHLVVQLDGYAFHSDAAQRRRDIRHDRELVARGYTVFRFDYDDIMRNWPRVEREIRRALAQGRAE